VDRPRTTELILIRHAPALTGGRLCGRTDAGADLTDEGQIAAVRRAAAGPARLVVSPALRCRQTAEALWPERAAEFDARLLEQDFGDWDGRLLADLPDLGPLSSDALAAHRPPRGESFGDMCGRVWPALMALASDGATIVAHAGVVRAALALALGDPALGLAFQIAPLSVTRLSAAGDGGWSIASVNWRAGDGAA
jgi:alpha-ribazole phosphatase